nr:CAAX prenyl protease-related protein [Duganella fentianensis]
MPFLAYMAFIVVADLLSRVGVDAATLRWLYPIKIGFVFLLLVVFWRQYQELASWRCSARLLAVAAAAGVVVLVLWLNLAAGWMVMGQSSGFDPRSGGQIDWSLALPRLAGATLVVPVMEELFWRSFLMRWLVHQDFEQVAPQQVGWGSWAVSSLLFGIEHNLWLAGLVAGLIYGFLYRRSGNIWAAIVAHGVTNGLLGIWIISTANWSYW